MNIKCRVEQEAFELFGEMRQLTKEEQKERNETLKRISKPTGENFFDLLERLKGVSEEDGSKSADY